MSQALKMIFNDQDIVMKTIKPDPQNHQVYQVSNSFIILSIVCL